MEESEVKEVGVVMERPRDKIAEKFKLTEAQELWVKTYLATGSGTQAAKLAYPNNKNPTAWGSNLKANTRIMKYIQETAMECAEIQFDQIIKNPKAPMAVRNDAIKDRLTRAGVGVDKDRDDGNNIFMGNITFTVDK